MLRADSRAAKRYTAKAVANKPAPAPPLGAEDAEGGVEGAEQAENDFVAAAATVDFRGMASPWWFSCCGSVAATVAQGAFGTSRAGGDLGGSANFEDEGAVRLRKACGYVRAATVRWRRVRAQQTSCFQDPARLEEATLPQLAVWGICHSMLALEHPALSTELLSTVTSLCAGDVASWFKVHAPSQVGLSVAEVLFDHRREVEALAQVVQGGAAAAAAGGGGGGGGGGRRIDSGTPTTTTTAATAAVSVSGRTNFFEAFSLPLFDTIVAFARDTMLGAENLNERFGFGRGLNPALALLHQVRSARLLDKWCACWLGTIRCSCSYCLTLSLRCTYVGVHLCLCASHCVSSSACRPFCGCAAVSRPQCQPPTTSTKPPRPPRSQPQMRRRQWLRNGSTS